MESTATRGTKSLRVLGVVLVLFALATVAVPSHTPAAHSFTNTAAATPPDTFDLSRIYGRIQLVNHFADYKVQVVDHFPDLRVQVVDHFPDAPGKWKMVKQFPDYKIQIVDHFPDFKIQYVGHFPGME